MGRRCGIVREIWDRHRLCLSALFLWRLSHGGDVDETAFRITRSTNEGFWRLSVRIWECLLPSRVMTEEAEAFRGFGTLSHQSAALPRAIVCSRRFTDARVSTSMRNRYVRSIYYSMLALLCCSFIFFLRQSSRAFSNPCGSISHLSPIRPHVLLLTMLSTIRSFRISVANASVLASRGKYRALYGSSLSFTMRSLALVSSTCLSTCSGSSGSGDVATPAQ